MHGYPYYYYKAKQARNGAHGIAIGAGDGIGGQKLS